MIRKIKRICAAAAAGIIAGFCLAMPVMAAADTSSEYVRMCDFDGVLNESEIERLEKRLDRVSEKTGMNAAVVIFSDAKGSSSYDWQDFADCAFDETFGVNTDGTLLYIRFDPNYVHLSTSGKGNEVYNSTDYYNDILDDVAPKLSSGDVYGAIGEYCLGLESYYGRYKSRWIFGGMIGLVCGAAAAGIVLFVVYTRYHKNLPVSAVNYAGRNNIRYTEKQDIFVRTYTTRTRIDSGGSGGGGGTHTSSSGGSHGGGGRSF